MTSKTTRTKTKRANKDRPNKENLKKNTKRLTKNLAIIEKYSSPQ